MILPRLLLIAATLAVPVAAADVLVVDDDGGPGVDFTSLPAAVAAASPGDILLVHDGVYEGVDGMADASAIIADDGATVEVPFVRIDFHAADRPVVLRDLGLQFHAPGSGTITVVVSQSPIWIEGCRMDTAAVASTPIGVALIRCVCRGRSLPGIDNNISHTVVLGCLARGGDGKPGFICPEVGPVSGGAGHFGLATSGGELLVSGTTMIGGGGGDGLQPDGAVPCTDGGPGGDGVGDDIFAFGNPTDVWLHDVVMSGGTGGLGGSDCQTGSAGLPRDFATSEVTDLAGSYRSVSTGGPVREGQPIVVTIEGEAGDSVHLLLSLEQEHAIVPALRGALLLAAPIALDPLVLPASGTLQLSVPAPELGPGVEGILAFIGAGFIDVNGDKHLGAPTSLAILDAAL